MLPRAAGRLPPSQPPPLPEVLPEVPSAVPEGEAPGEVPGEVPGEDWLGYPTERTVRALAPTAAAAAAAAVTVGGLRAGLGSASSRGRLGSGGRRPSSPNPSLGAPWERPASSGLHRAAPQGAQGLHTNEPRPSSRSAAERLHASAEHFPNPMVLAPLLPMAGHISEGPRGSKSRRQTPVRSPVPSPVRGGAAGQRNNHSPTNLGPAWNQNFGSGHGCQGAPPTGNPTGTASLQDSASAPNLPSEFGITGWG